MSTDSESLARIEAMLTKLVRSRSRPPAAAVSLRKAAAMLGVDRCTTLPEMIAAGSIRTVKIGGHTRISMREIDRVLEEGASMDGPRMRVARTKKIRTVEDEAEAILRLARNVTGA